MKTLLITAAFLSAVTFSLGTKSSYSAADFSKTSAYLQDTTPKRSTGQNKVSMQQGQYKDIKTGKPLALSYSQMSGMMYNGATGKPIDFYINAATGDTISGYGYVVNNYLLMQPDSS